ncbi:hypothetical protein [Dokdonella sp.]|uniref:hypothetical protein n=1 Tax=Dokdonella sp. TaxID=2291710 RepID=UPI0031BDF9E2|nr:hypothetical protein [Dokdonella sp.]
MMKKICAAAILAAFSTVAFAQDGLTCATPIEAHSNSTITGDTTAGGNSIAQIGLLPLSGAKSMIYDFTAQGLNATLTVTGSYDWGVFIVQTCNVTTSNPMTAITNTDATNVLDLAATATPAFVDGNHYFMIVSTNPGQPTNPNGPYQIVVTDILPVSLQSFEVL